jgi:hypothetical protein
VQLTLFRNLAGYLFTPRHRDHSLQTLDTHGGPNREIMLYSQHPDTQVTLVMLYTRCTCHIQLLWSCLCHTKAQRVQLYTAPDPYKEATFYSTSHTQSQRSPCAHRDT